jgi:SRSO17 transposase
LYLPEAWANDKTHRKEAGIPKEVQFQTKSQIALEQIRHAVEEEVTRGVVVADAGYGVDSRFRSGVTELGMKYAVGLLKNRPNKIPQEWFKRLSNMRGNDDQPQSGMFSYVSLEERVPADHPLRAIRKLADQVLQEMSAEFDGL